MGVCVCDSEAPSEYHTCHVDIHYHVACPGIPGIQLLPGFSRCLDVAQIDEFKVLYALC